uniref:Uncharacterized protein n=1 Tax=Mycena chlorophos TaxID=658473 RepID=A0ABQ0KZ51_MYCCL|nr:predicted protein [Mycena chlorophos]
MQDRGSAQHLLLGRATSGVSSRSGFATRAYSDSAARREGTSRSQGAAGRGHPSASGDWDRRWGRGRGSSPGLQGKEELEALSIPSGQGCGGLTRAKSSRAGCSAHRIGGSISSTGEESLALTRRLRQFRQAMNARGRRRAVLIILTVIHSNRARRRQANECIVSTVHRTALREVSGDTSRRLERSESTTVQPALLRFIGQ